MSSCSVLSGGCAIFDSVVRFLDRKRRSGVSSDGWCDLVQLLGFGWVLVCFLFDRVVLEVEDLILSVLVLLAYLGILSNGLWAWSSGAEQGLILLGSGFRRVLCVCCCFLDCSVCAEVFDFVRYIYLIRFVVTRV